ncbi:septation protein SepH [Gardnerella piotii]|uniref:Septation protein SepH n=1 Tax=Gardnerella piotii TaxID=2792977 RepID=A0ABU5MQE6_9BIFI|nr:septation protein SepH [Gardnerella piotii]MDZ7544613.1 septation protein SepH [Gardnerella piotii]MDZ7552022.1 septation protein SepH [Gardnerella piotii]
MLENPPKEASFDHVDNNGDLIFIFENTPLKIHVDDTLERAIAESKKLTNVDERNQNTVNSTGKSDDSPSATTATLPISQIQALIRAGLEPEHVAKRYNVSESQVRRFSSGVETEKQYAIEQFLTVPAPKQSNMRTLSDLIERTLAKAHIGMETVKWRATRRGLEPWLITAEFNTATRTIKAEWTWNMHDNSVACANPSARLLLGEEVMNNDSSKKSQFGGTYRDTVSISFPFANEDLPGNSIRSARIERAVSQWESRNSENLANVANVTMQAQNANNEQEQNAQNVQEQYNANNANKSLDQNNASSLDSLQSYEQNNNLSTLVANSENQVDANAVSNSINAVEIASNIANSSNSDSSKDSNNTNALFSNNSSYSSNSESRNEEAKEEQENQKDNHVQADKTVSIETPKSTQTQKSTKARTNEHSKAKKSSRAAVPSWDEILFGEG